MTARDGQERGREFRRRRDAFLAQDAAAGRLQLIVRIGEIRQMILDNRSGTSADEASISAVERAYLEWFCSARLFLPSSGPETIAPALEAEGFCLGPMTSS